MTEDARGAIDPALEAALRDTYAAILARDLDWTREAFLAVTGLRHVDTLAVSRDLLAIMLWLVHDRRRPTDASLTRIAQRVHDDNHEWVQASALPSVATLETVVRAASGQPPLTDVADGDWLFALVFLTANILQRLPEEILWTDFLDHVEDLIEDFDSGGGRPDA